MNCKPGDLALVVRARATPEMLGRIVTVVRAPVPGEIFKTDKGHLRWPHDTPDTPGVWVVTSNYPMPWNGRKGGKHFALERVFRDECLRPINPGDLVEDEDQINKLKEPA